MSGLTGWNGIPELVAVLEHASEQDVVDTCKQILATAQADAPTATGALSASGYTSTKEGDTYGEGFIEPGGTGYLLPDVGKPPNSHTGYVAFAVNYAWYVEFGTRYTPAQPFLVPALELEAAVFNAGDRLVTAIAKVVR